MASAPLAHRNAQYIDSHDKKLRKALSGAKISAAPMPKDIVSILIQKKSELRRLIGILVDLG